MRASWAPDSAGQRCMGRLGQVGCSQNDSPCSEFLDGSTAMDARTLQGLSPTYREPQSAHFSARDNTTPISLRRFVAAEGALAASSFIANGRPRKRARVPSRGACSWNLGALAVGLPLSGKGANTRAPKLILLETKC